MFVLSKKFEEFENDIYEIASKFLNEEDYLEELAIFVSNDYEFYTLPNVVFYYDYCDCREEEETIKNGDCWDCITDPHMRGYYSGLVELYKKILWI